LEEGEVDVMGNVIVTTPTKKPKTTQKKGEASSSAKRNKKRNVALATTDVPDLEQKSEGSAVPIKKLKSSTDDSCEFCGKLVKLVAPAKIALPNPQYEQLLNCSFLPPTDSPSGTRLFDSFFKFCSADKKNVVLISRPFRSTTLKESGVPVVVRQLGYLQRKGQRTNELSVVWMASTFEDSIFVAGHELYSFPELTPGNSSLINFLILKFLYPTNLCVTIFF